jgi:DNA polymerase III alpha subunit
MSGGIIHNPCINKSFANYIYGVDIYLGFMLLNNLNSDFIHNIVTERELNGDYTSVENLLIEYKPDWKAFKHLYLLVHSEVVNRKVN